MVLIIGFAKEFSTAGQPQLRPALPAAAINFYRRAIALDYGQVRWRMELAGLLVQDHRVLEAMKEARICLRLIGSAKG